MTQYTDVAITFTVTGVDLTTITEPHVTFEQGYTLIDVTDVNIVDASTFIVNLTQEQTGQFKEGAIKVQLNFFNALGKRKANKTPVSIPVGSNLLKRILGQDDED